MDLFRAAHGAQTRMLRLGFHSEHLITCSFFTFVAIKVNCAAREGPLGDVVELVSDSV